MTDSEQIAKARAEWSRLDRRAKELEASTRATARGMQNAFFAKEGRLPHPGDSVFAEIGAIRDEARDALTAADNARSALDQAVGLASGDGLRSAIDRRATPIARNLEGPGRKLAETLQSDPSILAQPTAAVLLPSFLEGYGGMPSMQAAFNTNGVSGTYFDSRLSELPSQSLSVLDLLPAPTPVQSLGGDTLQYLRETAPSDAQKRDNKAAVVDQLGLKPETELQVSLESTRLATVAHITKNPIAIQLLYSFPDLEGFVNNTMGRGVRQACQDLVINGSGSGSNPTGILNASGTNSIAVAGNRLDAIRHAITVLQLIDVEPDGVILNPNDWEDYETTKDTDGNYIVTDPRGDSPARVWRLRPAVNRALAQGTVIVGAFQTGCRWWDGSGRLEWGTIDDDFQRNQVRMRAENGFAFAVTRPQNFVTVTGF
jgi:hypothetical protein